jgi:predicted nucleic acid-binding protein
MSVVVADNSPIDVLVRLGCEHLLPTLFGQIVIPRQVQEELLSLHTPRVTRQFVLSPPEWFQVREPLSIESIPRLHAGEEAAISLALEMKAELPLIDEERGRQEAIKRGLAITGVIGILEASARRHLLDLREIFARLVSETDFRINPDFLPARLELFESETLD